MLRLIILARFTKITLPKIYSKPKQITFWRDSPKAHHGKSADHSRASFHGSRQITAIGRLQHSFISRNSADQSIASFHGKSADHSIASFHGKLADHSIASFHGKSADHRIASFHGSRQSTAWGHFHSRAISQGRRAFHRVVAHFTGSRQITGSRISQHSIISRKVYRSQHGAISILGPFHRLAPNHRAVAHFTGSRQTTGS